MWHWHKEVNAAAPFSWLLRACRVDSPLSEIRGYLAHDLPNRVYPTTLLPLLLLGTIVALTIIWLVPPEVAFGSGWRFVALWLPACLLR